MRIRMQTKIAIDPVIIVAIVSDDSSPISYQSVLHESGISSIFAGIGIRNFKRYWNRNRNQNLVLESESESMIWRRGTRFLSLLDKFKNMARYEQAGIGTGIRIKGLGLESELEWNQYIYFAGIRIGIRVLSFPGIRIGIGIKLYPELCITAINIYLMP